jgi:rhamnulokinase
MSGSPTDAGTHVAAVDFGASSIRVSVVDLDRRPLEPVEVHRHHHAPIRHADGSLRWDWDMLVAEARRGLAMAVERAPLASIGIDTWGLDYGLLDDHGRLVAPPHSYRDERLTRWRAVADRIGPRRLYDITGTQLMAGNTIFQLAAHDRRELARTRHLLMLPELLLHELCGVVLAERTSAGTTALIDRRTGTWSDELIEAIDADRSWFGDLHVAGEVVGTIDGVPVHLVGGHDTASAVLAMGAAPRPGAAFLSAGTLFLVGRERPSVDAGDECFVRNLSNEPGVYDGVRLLGNLPGMWLLEECRRRWDVGSVAELLGAPGADPDRTPVIDVSDPSLVAPVDMPSTVCALAGLPDDAPRAAVVDVIVESLAVAVAAAVDRLEIGDPVDELVVFGGAVRAQRLLDRLAERCRRPVRTGPTEATTLGNALAQGIALGVFTDVDDARSALAGT